jgi:hypothetical protein
MGAFLIAETAKTKISPERALIAFARVRAGKYPGKSGHRPFNAV